MKWGRVWWWDSGCKRTSSCSPGRCWSAAGWVCVALSVTHTAPASPTSPCGPSRSYSSSDARRSPFDIPEHTHTHTIHTSGETFLSATRLSRSRTDLPLVLPSQRSTEPPRSSASWFLSCDPKTTTGPIVTGYQLTERETRSVWLTASSSSRQFHYCILLKSHKNLKMFVQKYCTEIPKKDFMASH